MRIYIIIFPILIKHISMQFLDVFYLLGIINGQSPVTARTTL